MGCVVREDHGSHTANADGNPEHSVREDRRVEVDPKPSNEWQELCRANHEVPACARAAG